MFDETLYQHKLTRPTKGEFTTHTFYNPVAKKEQTIPGAEVKRTLETGQTIQHEGVELVFLNSHTDEKGFQDAKNAYVEEGNQLHRRFYEDLLNYEGLPDNPFTKFLFEKAWANHHSNGHNAVWDAMCDYTEIYEMAESHFLTNKG